MTLRRGDFRDPLTILIERENGLCKGCKFEVVVFDKRVCQSITRKWGRRCSAYTEKENIRVDFPQELPK